MPYKEKETLETTLRSIALNVFIKSSRQIADKTIRYNDAAFDLDDLSAVCKKFCHNKIEMNDDLQEKLYDTTKIILDHYPKKQKIALDIYRPIYKCNGQMIPLSKKYPTKFADKIITIL